MNQTFINLTHKFTLPMPVWEGDPEPMIQSTASIESDGFKDEEVTSGLHVGTHIDAPAHIFKGGKVISDYPLERFMRRGVLVDARGKSVIDVPLLRGVELRQKDIVLVLTGWSKYYKVDKENGGNEGNEEYRINISDEDKYFSNFPEVTEAFAEKLIETQVSMLALDTPSPDTEPFEIHRLLLENDILIAENLNNVEQLVNIRNFEMLAFPLNLPLNASPTRFVAKVESRN